MSFLRVCSLLLLVATSAQAEEPSWEQRQSIPRWAVPLLEHPGFSENYPLSTRLNPFLVQGDFNGDGRIDLAILVEQKDTRAAGIAIVHAGAGRPIVTGAGTPLGAGGRDFSWMKAWQVYSKGPVLQGAGPEPPPELRGDALLVKALEAASAVIYWNGSEYRWYQQGD